jgi:hypothetical protein
MVDLFSWHISGNGRRRYAPVAYRPVLEQLEDRTLLSFNAPIVYPADGSPLAAGDFTGTGVLDLVVSHGNGAVSILPGNGDGSFQPELPPIAVGPDVFSVAVADLRHNGIRDLVVTHANADAQHPDSTVSVLLGNGDRTFQPPVSYQVGVNPRSVAIGDLRHNGTLDIVTANFGTFAQFVFIPGTTVSVLLGNGDGTFGPASTFDTGVYPESVALGDFAGDGRLSIVTADNGFFSIPGDVGFLQGNGDGTFQPPRFLGLGISGAGDRSVAVADLNGDGHPDVISADDASGGGAVSVLLGRGDNTFQNAVTFRVTPDPNFLPTYLALGDFSGDGHLDAAVTGILGSFPRAGLYLLPGNGDGTFGTSTTVRVEQTRPVVVGEFNGDGIDDLAVGNGSQATGNGSVSILLGQSGLSLNFPRAYPAGAGATSIRTADLLGNGLSDLVTANAQDNTVSVLLANGDGTFQPQVAYPVGRDPESVVAADLTGRGIPDLVVLNSGDRSITVLRGQGDGTSQTAQTLPLQLAPGFIPVRLAVGDFDGDGTPDLAVLQTQQGGGPTGLLVLRGNPDGTFFQDPTLPDQSIAMDIFDPFQGNYIFQAAALGSDRALDLVVGAAGNSVAVLHGNGDGTFGAPQFLRFANTPTSVAVGDLNGDGIPDLVVTTRSSSSPPPPSSVFVLLGNSDGTFQAPVGYGVRGDSFAAAIGDFNGDGIPDLAVAGFNTLEVLRGNGDGTFGALTSYLVGGRTVSLSVGDFNGDGAPDLAVGILFAPDVTVVLNRNDGLAPGRGDAPQPPHPAAAQTPLGPLDATLGQAVAQTPPAGVRLDTAPATSAGAGGTEAAADAYFAALAGEEHAGFLQRRAESHNALNASRPVGYPDEDLAAPTEE